MDLISKKNVYDYADGTSFVEYNKNKFTGEIKKIKVTLSKKHHQPILFGIWPNWDNRAWVCLGYEIKK